ncbi:hypothetical protein PF003_g35065 [Phytophthora fragariae]|nr:hypothetical protein PF003_g35065 [Phytophthora fragariae]
MNEAFFYDSVDADFCESVGERCVQVPDQLGGRVPRQDVKDQHPGQRAVPAQRAHSHGVTDDVRGRA